HTRCQAERSLARRRVGDDWAWPGAEAVFKRAIQLNANSATAHPWYGGFLARLGRSEEARTELKKAQELDPLSLLINTSVGRQLYFARQYETAIQPLKQTLDMARNFL